MNQNSFNPYHLSTFSCLLGSASPSAVGCSPYRLCYPRALPLMIDKNVKIHNLMSFLFFVFYLMTCLFSLLIGVIVFTLLPSPFSTFFFELFSVQGLYT
eukprot:UN04670